MNLLHTVQSGPPLRAIYDVLAPAKLNLFLHITGRRPDGYHLIQSVFMLIDWCDLLHFELRRDGKISRSDLNADRGQESDRLPAEDLTVRAAQALQQACGTSLGVHIELDKRIPSQAGMGGGSSDAASCLLALQRLWGVSLPRQDLLDMALKLGADVPFFLSGGHAWVEGVGEIVRPISLPPAQFLVIKPVAGLSTKAIFGASSLRRDTETATLEGFAANTTGPNSSAEKVFGFGRNDLQPVALDWCPQIAQSMDWLGAHGLEGRMTGSGSAVFAHLPHNAEISRFENDSRSDWKFRLCSNLEEHPLAAW